MKITRWPPATLGLCARGGYSLALARRLLRCQGGGVRLSLSEWRNRIRSVRSHDDILFAAHFHAYCVEKARFHQEGWARAGWGCTGSLYLCLNRKDCGGNEERKAAKRNSKRTTKVSGGVREGKRINPIRPIRQIIDPRHIRQCFGLCRAAWVLGLETPGSFSPVWE